MKLNLMTKMMLAFSNWLASRCRNKSGKKKYLWNHQTCAFQGDNPQITRVFRAKIAAKPPTVYHLAILTLRYSKKHIRPRLKVCCQQKVIKYWPQPQTLVVGKNPSKILVDLLQVWFSPKCINTVISWSLPAKKVEETKIMATNPKKKINPKNLRIWPSVAA